MAGYLVSWKEAPMAETKAGYLVQSKVAGLVARMGALLAVRMATLKAGMMVVQWVNS